jgi:CBS domain containing-hemolysin-like protein
VSPLLLILVAALIAANAFFVIAEYALVRSRRPRLEAARDDGARGAALALRQIADINAYISTCQVGITMTSLGVGALGEPSVSHLLRGPLGVPLSHGVAVALAAAIAYMLITGAHITLGEIVPKIYTIEHAERLARQVARPLELARIAFSPISTVLVGLSGLILRPLGIRPETVTAEEGGSAEELKLIIAQSLRGGHIDPGEAGMLSGVFELHEQEVRQVMTPIPAVVTVDTSEGLEVALRRCAETGHTRLLVTEDENPDRVRGIVHVNSLSRALLNDGPEALLEPLVMDVPIIPETKPLDDLLAELQRQRLTMAVVVDEYGRVAGIVTVEDILEEVVGEIEDETDPAGGAVRRLANGDWFVRGHVAVTDLKDYGLELPVDTDAYNSIGGFVFNELGRLPRRGDTIAADGYSIRVESVRENRIEAVRIRARQALA